MAVVDTGRRPGNREASMAVGRVIKRQCPGPIASGRKPVGHRRHRVG